MVEVMKMMVTSFTRSHDALMHTVPPTLQQATADLCLPRDSWTHGQVWVSLLWGHCSFLLGPRCAQGFVCALQESVSPVLCKFWRLYGGV